MAIDALLTKVKLYRKKRQFPEALEALHQLSNKYPGNVSIIYLLAITYYESRNEEKALKYCNAALEKDDNCKEAYELKGILLKRKGEYADSEKNLLKSLSIDENMHNARTHLIAVYYFYLQDYPTAEAHCVYMFKHRDPERDTMSRQGKIEVFDWFLLVSGMYESTLIRQKKYREAAEHIKYRISFGLSITYDPSSYVSDHADLYDLYCISGDEENRQELYKYLREFYKVSESEIKGWEESLKKDGYIPVMLEESMMLDGL